MPSFVELEIDTQMATVTNRVVHNTLDRLWGQESRPPGTIYVSATVKLSKVSWILSLEKEVKPPDLKSPLDGRKYYKINQTVQNCST